MRCSSSRPASIALSAIDGTANTLVRINPLTGLFEAFRDVLALRSVARPLGARSIPFAYAAVLLVVFVPLYRSEARHFAKVVE